MNVKLTTEEVEYIRKLSENADAVLGLRYPPAHAAMLLVDTPAREERGQSL